VQSRNPGWMSDDPLRPAGLDCGDPLRPATPDSRSPRPDSRSSLVYFSSVSENTHRFVQKLGLPATRIPLHGRIEVDQPYVLLLPTYGGGRATPDVNAGGYVPKQVIAFLNNEHNRSLIRGVIAAGNNNFGAEFAYAGNVVSRKCGVPYLYRFELMGTPDDVEAVRVGLAEFWKDQTCHQPSLQSL
jgi:protein involved in ribonucleotide reduction